MEIDVPLVARRAAAALVVVLVVPLVVTLGTLADEAPIVEGEPSPRTITTDRALAIPDREATEQARLEAEQSVDPVTSIDLDVQRDIFADISSVFAAVRLASQPVEVEQPAPSPEPGATEAPTPTVETVVPTVAAQVEQLRDQVEGLDEEGLRELVQLQADRPQRVVQLEEDVNSVTQELVRPGITEAELDDVLSVRLPRELSLETWPGTTASTVAEPLIRSVLRPNELPDPVETEQRREAAREAVEEVTERYAANDVVVEAGEVVTAVQLQALEQLGEAGSAPGIAYVRALVAMVLAVVVFGLYLRIAQPEIWADPGRLFVLASVMLISAALFYAVKVLAATFGAGWWFAFPIGGIVLLLSVLTTPMVGTVSVLPIAALSLLFAPSVPALTIFVAAVTVLAAPMTTRISTRVGLRRANVRVAAAAPVIAVTIALVFGPRDQAELPVVLLAALIGGIANAGLLQGLLPAFENVFRLATVTALLDLADRNHPLLRELEAKAMGSYNHSVMVASLAERCCREIGASHLLGQVAGLYHDIGKVRQPVFFIENQRGIANPHDQLTPRMSAVIIQNHVTDGVEMATEHRLPPSVVDCIASHHGTMRVGYFWRQAVEAAGGDESAVDESHFRYNGHRPRSKEAAILLLSDCCEAATRAMAMDRGTLPTDVIEKTVDQLLRERLDDGQFDDCELTFTELQTVRNTLVDALTGIYHPRIGYPGGGEAQPVR